MTQRMTSSERMMAVMTGQKPDRVPVVPFALGYSSKITGISLGDFYADGDKCFEAQFASMRLHGYEQILCTGTHHVEHGNLVAK